MKIKDGQSLEPGDRVRATNCGYSRGMHYKKGDTGIVRSKAGAHFDVTLDDGRQLGIVWLENWEKIETVDEVIRGFAEPANPRSDTSPAVSNGQLRQTPGAQ